MKKELYLFPVVLMLLLIGMLFVSVQPASALMFGCDNGTPANLFRIDPGAGTATFVGTLPVSMTECVYNAINGQLYAQVSDGGFTLYHIDPATGASLGSVPTGAALNGMEFVGNTLYATVIVAPAGPSTLVTVDPATGVLTPIGATGFGPISGLAYNASTGIMYGITGGAALADLITIDLTTGAGTVVAPTGIDRIGSIEFDNGVLYGGLTSTAAVSPNFLVSINTTTGAVIPLFDTGFSITGLAAVPSLPAIVPTMNEWGMIAFMLLAGLSSVYFIRRQRRAA